LKNGKSSILKKAYAKKKDRIKITKDTLDELGERLYAKITEVVIPEWTAAFEGLTLQDCKDYIYEVTIVRTYDGFLLEKSVINDGLAKIFPEIETVFFLTVPELTALNSSIVRDILRHGGDVSQFIPEGVDL